MEERRRDILHVLVVIVERYARGRSKRRPYDGIDFRFEISGGRATA